VGRLSRLLMNKLEKEDASIHKQRQAKTMMFYRGLNILYSLSFSTLYIASLSIKPQTKLFSTSECDVRDLSE
jgi:hypothetical protein